MKNSTGLDFMLASILMSVAFGMLAAACSHRDNTGNPMPSTNSVHTEYSLGAGYYAIEFKLVDGTRCMAIRKAGITCEWRHGAEEGE